MNNFYFYNVLVKILNCTFSLYKIFWWSKWNVPRWNSKQKNKQEKKNNYEVPTGSQSLHRTVLWKCVQLKKPLKYDALKPGKAAILDIGVSLSSKKRAALNTMARKNKTQVANNDWSDNRNVDIEQENRHWTIIYWQAHQYHC